MIISSSRPKDQSGLLFAGVKLFVWADGKPAYEFDLVRGGSVGGFDVVEIIEENAITLVGLEVYFNKRKIPFTIYHVNPDPLLDTYITQMVLGAIAGFVAPRTKTIEAGSVTIIPRGNEAEFVGYIEGSPSSLVFEGKGNVWDNTTGIIKSIDVRPVELIKDKNIVVAGEYAFRGGEVLYIGTPDITEAKLAFEADDRAKFKVFYGTVDLEEFKKNYEPNGYAIFYNKVFIGMAKKMLKYTSLKARLNVEKEVGEDVRVAEGELVVKGNKVPIFIKSQGNFGVGVLFAIDLIAHEARKAPIDFAFIRPHVPLDYGREIGVRTLVCASHGNKKGTVWLILTTDDEIGDDVVEKCLIKFKDPDARIAKIDNDTLIMATSRGTFVVDNDGNIRPLSIIDKEDIEMLE